MKQKIIKFICLFLFKREWRAALKDRFGYCMSKDKFYNFLSEIENQEHLVYVNKEDSPKKILHYGTYKAECGIAQFLEDMLSGLENIGYKYNAVYPVNYDYVGDPLLLKAYLDKLIEHSKDFDAVFMQHEYGFWASGNISCLSKELENFRQSSNLIKINNINVILLDYLVSKLISAGKIVNIVWHTTFTPLLEEISKCYKIKKNDYKKLPFFRFFDNGLFNVVVMNQSFIDVLKEYEIPVERVQNLQLPVPTLVDTVCENDIVGLREKYGFKKDDIVLASFGFVNILKGIENILGAMKYLPENYKYVHLGGLHARANKKYLINLQETIKKLGLSSRAFITGFLTEEELAIYKEDLNFGLYVGSMKNSYASAAINHLIIKGIPTITSNIANFKAIEAKYHNIVIVDNPENSEQLAKLIININNDEAKKNELRENCARFCEENTFENFANKIVEKIDVLEKGTV